MEPFLDPDKFATDINKGQPQFLNYNEAEEITVIKELNYLTFSSFKAYIIVPLLTICSGLMFGICLYWSTNLRITFFYSREQKLNKATHILVKGYADKLEIKPLYSSSL